MTLHSSTRVRLLIVMALCIAFAVAAACGESASPTSYEESEPSAYTPATSLLVPSPTPERSIVPNPTWFVSPSLEEQIFKSDVIMRASLLSAAAATETVPSAGEEVAQTYRPLQELRFTVHEYLKGSGPAEVLVVVRGEHTYLTDTEAREVADESVSDRNTVWDGRQGAIFLGSGQTASGAIGTASGGPSGASGSPSVQTFAFTLYNPIQSEWDYTVDTLSRAWLPAQDTGTVQAAGASGQSADLEFITDGSKSPPPTITLAELRSAISEMEATLKAGEGIEGFEECISGKILYERIRRAIPRTPVPRGKTLASGSEAGSEIYKGANTYREPKYSRFWSSGPDTDYFQTVIVDDDSSSANGYEHMLSTTRPLPVGRYRVFYNEQGHTGFPCDFLPDDAYNDWTVTVTAPSGTLHEAFFDPEDIGASVGADSYYGVLEPAQFTAEGDAATTIRRIAWNSNRAWMELSTSTASLTGHHIDFIELDGSVGLRLDFDDATATTTEDGAHTLVWGVCDQPWSAGDKLMARMSLSEGSLTGATNDASCDGVAIDPTIPMIRIASFHPTSDVHVKPVIVLNGSASGCGVSGIWACLDEDDPDGEGSMAYLFTGSALRVGFTVGSDAIPGQILDARFEVTMGTQSGTVEPGQYGYAVYRGSDVVATVSGQESVGTEWADLVVADTSITSALSGGVTDVAIQIDAPSSGPRLKLTRVMMVVVYDATGTGE